MTDAWVDAELIGMFIGELETGSAHLSDLVLAIERGSNRETHEEAMRLAHSLKGAARIIEEAELVEALHAAEEVLATSVQTLSVTPGEVRNLLALVDILSSASSMSPAGLKPFLARQAASLGRITADLRTIKTPAKESSPTVDTAVQSRAPEAQGAIRVNIDTMGRLLGHASEVVVETRNLASFERTAFSLGRTHHRLAERLTALERFSRDSGDLNLVALIQSVRHETEQAQHWVDAIRELASASIQRLSDAGERLYYESIRARQRPFSQLFPSLRRQVRDGATEQNKQVKIELVGGDTLVDGDVLAVLETALIHLVTNAIDHGIEAPELREDRGKPTEGVIRVELRQSRGMLALEVTDDGGGIDHERLRSKVIERGMIDRDTAVRLTSEELAQFLFLPGFSTAQKVSRRSGRGFGLDSVKSTVERIGGRISIGSSPQAQTFVQVLVPVTRLVVRALLVSVAREIYALPLLKTGRVIRVSMVDVRTAEGRDFVEVDGQNIGVVRLDDLLEIGARMEPRDELTFVLFGDEDSRYALLVERALGETDLLVRPLDERLGRVPDVAASAMLPDGSPTLLLDADELLRSVEKATSKRGTGSPIVRARVGEGLTTILVAEDSPTVRAAERELLTNAGFSVDVAADGAEAWQMLNARQYDLALVDIDMPHVTGLELVARARAVPTLEKMPIIIVSYKDREDDRQKGMAVGASAYFPKSSFRDDELVRTIRELLAKRKAS